MAFRFARFVGSRNVVAAFGATTTVMFTGSNSYFGDEKMSTRCDAAPATTTKGEVIVPAPVVQEELYHSLFPKRQLYVPKKEYPLWDANWDSKQPVPLEDKDLERRRQRMIRKTGVTRHVILIRHGQYDESSKDDEKRVLTKLGREQADLTGQRIAEIIRGEVTVSNDSSDDASGGDGDDDDENSQNKKSKKKSSTPCHVKILRVSDLTRAKETADIIAQHLPGVERADPDPLLNEGRPSHTIPGGKVSTESIQRTDEQGKRIEEAFLKYFYRSEDIPSLQETNDETSTTTTTTAKDDSSSSSSSHHHLHEFEIIVGHANVIRYFLMRALQLPPEAWLRFCNLNCSLTYLTIRPTGTVSCRMFGDIGHLPYSKSTFSGHHGFNW